MSMRNFSVETLLWQFALDFSNGVIHEDSTTENNSVDISSSQFYQRYYRIWLSNGVNVRFLHRILQVHTDFNLSAISTSTISPQGVAKLVGEYSETCTEQMSSYYGLFYHSR